MRYDVDAADDDFDEYDFMMRMIMPIEKMNGETPDVCSDIRKPRKLLDLKHHRTL